MSKLCCPKQNSNVWAIGRVNRPGRRAIRKEAHMASPKQSGQSGHNPVLVIIAMIVIVPHVDRTWLAVCLGAIVLYGLAVDWVNRK